MTYMQKCYKPEEKEKKSEEKTHFTSVNMPSTSTEKPEFVPIASYVAFAFIGAVMLVGLVARCLASNNSTVRGANSLDLMIYQAAPKSIPVPKPRRSSIEQ